MPELPEAEVVRLGLAEHITDRAITSVTVLHPRPVRSFAAGPQAFAEEISHRVFAVPKRRGKYLWLPFHDGDALIAHLGMSGQFRIDDPETELARNTRVTFQLDNGRELRFVDQRMFGGLQFSPRGAGLPSEIAHIARDPFDPKFDVEQVVERIRAKRTTIKRALLDQKVVSGIGNIYADESLWQARTHYDHPTQQITKRRVRAVLAAATDVMRRSLAEGGTSFDSLYVNINGSSGYFSRSLNVYGREGEPCPRCATKIRRDSFMNRSSYLCPRCQRRPAQKTSADSRGAESE